MCQIAVVASERPLFPLINTQSELPLCVLPPPAQGSGGSLHPRQVTGTAPCQTAGRCE
jgi:hypothetical protein